MNLSPNLSQKTWRNPVTRALGHYGAGSALQEPHTARPDLLSVGMASTNPRGGSMGLQGPPYAVLLPLVTDPLAPPGDPESSLFLTCHFVRKARREYKIAGLGKTHTAYVQFTVLGGSVTTGADTSTRLVC